jgi:hypothetical protein
MRRRTELILGFCIAWSAAAFGEGDDVDANNQRDNQTCVKALLALDAIVEKDELGNVTCVNLASIEISDDDLCHLEGLVTLRELNLSSTPVGNDGLSHCRHLTTLEKLYLGNTRIDDDGMVYVENLRNLRELVLPICVSDSSIKRIRQLPLRVLYARSPRITDDGLSQLASMLSLQTLFLDGSRFTDDAVSSLKRLRNLEVLDIYRNPICADRMKELYDALPKHRHTSGAKKEDQ